MAIQYVHRCFVALFSITLMKECFNPQPVRGMRKGQILTFALAFFMLPALSVMASAQDVPAGPGVEIDCGADPVMECPPIILRASGIDLYSK